MSFLAWQRLSDKAHFITAVSWLVLLCVQLIDSWSAQLPWIICLAKILPLLIFLPGILSSNLRSHLWLCFVCLLYFLTLVERLFAQPDSVLAIVGMIAVVTLFNASMFFVRWRARELKQQ